MSNPCFLAVQPIFLTFQPPRHLVHVVPQPLEVPEIHPVAQLQMAATEGNHISADDCIYCTVLLQYAWIYHQTYHGCLGPRVVYLS